jgi:hypothetical protein
LRRWDQASDAVTIDSAAKTLESNIQVKFGGTGFRTGDYWVFAARTATRDVELLTDAPPQGVEHHYCKLGLITWSVSGGQLQSAITDCRLKFPPLTHITAGDVAVTDSCGLGVNTLQDAFNEQCNQRSLRYLGGDGQEGEAGAPLAGSLLVGVEDGFGRPVASVNVNFAVDLGGGSVSSSSVLSDSAGLASVTWTLGPVVGSNEVRVQLDASIHHLPIVFRAVGFTSATGLVALRYVGGDGQQGPAGSQLPCQLIVGVEDGNGHPVPNAKVRFKASSDGDTVFLWGTSTAGSSTIDIVTNAGGLAEAGWRLGATPGCHQVIAYFASEEGASPPVHLDVVFEAQAVVPAPQLPMVASINWTNDVRYPLAFVDRGLTVDFTEDMSARTANQNTFIVIVELAEGTSADQYPFQWHRPIILQGDVKSTKPTQYMFTPNPQLTQATLGVWLKAEQQLFSDQRVRVRVRLLGDSILNAAGTHRLDGNMFGPAFGPNDVGFPSGDGIEGGDFQSWFWLDG